MRLPRSARYTLVGAGILAAWGGFGLLLRSRGVWHLAEAFTTLAEQRFGMGAEHVANALLFGSLWMAQMALLAATLGAPVAMLLRARARVRLRVSGEDVLEPLRRHLARHTWRAHALTWAPAVAFTLVGAASYASSSPYGDSVALLAFLPAMLAVTGLTRWYLRLLAAPPASAEDLVPQTAADDELFFSAVAVTREARALVAAFAAANVAAVVASGALQVTTRHVFAYAAFALLGIFAFRRASRIAVGLDGVLVTGTSRRRFFGYRDLDAVEIAASGDIVVRGRGREVLRLQLGGDDAPRLAAIVERIRAGIERARAEAGDGAQRFAESAGAAALASAASGRADYRGRAAAREDLLALVESPATGVEARAAAAGALGRAADAEEQQRLRVAAGLCAEPAARAVLLRVAGNVPVGEEEPEEAEAAPAVRRATLTR